MQLISPDFLIGPQWTFTDKLFKRIYSRKMTDPYSLPLTGYRVNTCAVRGLVRVPKTMEKGNGVVEATYMRQ